MRYIIAALLLVLCINTYAYQRACKCSISAQVIEKHNSEIIFPAVVHIDELQKDYDVSTEGKILIRDLCPGTYTIHVHAYGYEHYAEIITLTGRSDLKFNLSHMEHILSEVNVSGRHNPVSLLQTKAQLDKDAIAANSGRTLSEMLQQVNGVTLLSNGGNISKPVVHGLHSNRVVLLNNGVRQEDQQWGSEHAPNIDPFLANNITVIKGAAGVRYGTDAIGGVVLIEPAPLRTTPGTDGEVNLAAFSNNRMGVASAMIEHNFKDRPELSVRLQGTYRKGGNYHIPGYWAANTGTEEKNYSATVGWRKRHYNLEAFYSHFDTDLGIYRGAHTGNQKDLLAAIESPVPLVQSGFTYDIERPKQHVTHDLIKAKLMADTRIGIFNLTYAFQHNYRQEYDVVRIDNGEPQLNLTLNTQSLNLNFDHKQWGKFSGQAGIDGFYQENYFKPGDRLFIPNFTSVNAALYAIERYKAKKWTLEGGLRYDLRNYEVFNPEGNAQQVVHYTFDYNNLSATLGFMHQLSRNWNWSATLSSAWRAPQPTELFSAGLHHSAARIELGNKDLQAERSYNVNIEAKHTLSDVFTLELQTYMQYINNFIYLSPGAPIQTIRGYYKSFSYQQSDVLLNGLDISLLYKFNKNISSNLKASFLRAENLTLKGWLIQMPSDRLSLGIKYTTDSSTGKRFRNTFIGISGRIVLQQQRIPDNFKEIDYPMPPEGYELMDAEAGTTLMLKNQPIHISVSVLNIFDTRYRDYMDAFRYFIDQPGRNVALRLRVPFNF